MSTNLEVSPVLLQIYQDNKSLGSKDATGVWDELLKLIQDVIQKVLNTTIGANGKTINDIITDVKTGITNTVENVRTTVTNVLTVLSSRIDGVISTVNNAVNDIVDGVTSSIGDVIQGITDGIKEALDNLIAKISDIIDTLKNIGNQIGKWISDALENISGYITDAISNAIDAATAYILETIENVKNWLKDTYNSIKDTITDVYNRVSEWVVNAYTTVKDAITGAIEGIKTFAQDVNDFVFDKIRQFQEWLNGLVTKAGDWIVNQIAIVKDWYHNTLTPLIATTKELLDSIGKTLSNLWDMISSGNYQGAFDYIDNIATNLGIPAPVHVLYAIISTITYFYETVKIQFVPLEVAAQKRAIINLALEPLSTGEAANGVYRGLWNRQSFINNQTLSGISKDKAEVALEVNRPLPTPGQAQQMFLRGIINVEDHDNILASYGFSREHIAEIKSLYAIIPGVQDIITMAVKEAFTPAIAERFGQYEDLPEAFVTWASKQGLSSDWAGRYWAAHWDLPSPQMGFDMYQRRIIDHDDLVLLLKALDIMPFWREKLIQLSYNPLTRIDIRRMYKMGVISEQQVYDFHLDIGYSPENARLLTDFTKRYSAPEDQTELDKFQDIARSTYSAAYKDRIISVEEYRTFLANMKYANEDIDLLISLDDYAIIQKERLFDPGEYRNTYYKMVISGYNRGLFNREDAKGILAELGLSDDESEMELNLIDYNRQVTLKDILIQQLHNQYVSFIINGNDLHTILDTFGFYASEIDRLIEEWEVEKSFRDKRPALTDIRRFYNDGLITQDEYLDELRGIGYHEKYIDLYKQSLEKAKR